MAVVARRVLFSSMTLWVLLTALGVYLITPIDKKVKRGIDLVGGTYITLQVHTAKAVENEIFERMRSMEARLLKEKLPAPLSTRVENGVGVMTFADAVAATQSGALLAREARMSVEQSDREIMFVMSADERLKIERAAVEGNVNVLRARMLNYGTEEISITAVGSNRIVVELPDVHNPQQAKAMIGTPAILEIKLVQDFEETEERLCDKYGGQLPHGTVIIFGDQSSGNSGAYLVPQYTDLTGAQLSDARVGQGGRLGVEPVVEFAFKPDGAERFRELTSENIGRRIALVLDNKVITAPVVQSVISDRGSITGNFTSQSAKQLATMLRSGAFVAPVTFEEERHIGPSLGAEAIRQGVLACAVGMALLFLFSVLVYKTAGLLAFIVLLFNIFFSLVALAQLKAALTLPGIAGMILTIGMAIDSSILIYERIREELARGVALRTAIQTGFSGALVVILDANITHFLVALVLYNLGAGPIQGFAVTMIVGIAATLLTGLLMLRSFFTFLTDVIQVRSIKF